MNNVDNQQTVGFLRLTAAIFYDALLLAAVLFFATLPLILFPEDIRSIPVVEVLKVLWYLLVSYLYFAGFWLKGGQTPGMKPWKITLVGMQGNKPNKKQVTLRFFSAILSWALAGLGFLWMIVDHNHLSLHDHLSGSRLLLLKKP
ncbi:MAG: RDD family protein [Arenicellales bacterium]